MRIGGRPPMRTVSDADMDTPYIIQSHVSFTIFLLSRMPHMIALVITGFMGLQPDTIDARIVPRVGMTFPSVDDAYNFYCKYAYEVGFPLKRYRERRNCKWLNCSMEGKCAPRSADNPKVRKTTSMRTQCKAGMKLKKIYDDAKEKVVSVRVDLINFEHNHEFIKRDSEKDHLQCNKTHDPEYMEFLGAMQDSRVPQHCIMDFVSEMHGGPENVPVTAQDLSNLYGTSISTHIAQHFMLS